MSTFRSTLFPLFLLTVCPVFVLFIWHALTAGGGELSSLAAGVDALHLLGGTPRAWAIIGSFAAFELVLMRVLPGKRVEGPVTPSGYVPTYTANGPLAFVVTVAVWFALTLGGVVPGGIVYDAFGEILGALDGFALVACLGLYFKGKYAPSTPDHGLTGNFIFDYYWGTELYPSVLGWNVKQFTNCRFGMMGWAVILLSYAAAQAERTGLSDGMVVAVGLQLVYIAKFFWWEDGYLRSLDIMHDRAGFYIVWGCLVWLPATYTSSTLFLVEHPNPLGPVLAGATAVIGTAAIIINYLADRQRQMVRATNGKCTVWGKPPVTILAKYTTEKGEAKENLLLVSGWWGVARHFHYIPELVGAFAWVSPVGLGHFLPWFYAFFLCILLTDRATRDDGRCQAKYGPAWDEYRARVPYKMIPGIY